MQRITLPKIHACLRDLSPRGARSTPTSSPARAARWSGCWRSGRTRAPVNREPPIVIVGGGVAGLSTALACAPRPVLLLSRGDGSEGSASLLAQGGIAAALGPGDSPPRHLATRSRPARTTTTWPPRGR